MKSVLALSRKHPVAGAAVAELLEGFLIKRSETGDEFAYRRPPLTPLLSAEEAVAAPVFGHVYAAGSWQRFW